MIIRLFLSLIFAVVPVLSFVRVSRMSSGRSLNLHKSDAWIDLPSGRSHNNTNNSDGMITIIGFGSLLSEQSSRLTFPELSNFRLGRIPHYRRVFGHVASIFFQRGIANFDTLECSSLSAEYVSDDFPGFICTLFEVSTEGLMEDGVPSHAFREREEEFNIITVPFLELDSSPSKCQQQQQQGLLCARSSDDIYIRQWGQERYHRNYKSYGIPTIWDWKEDSGLKPCSVYLRHCVLAAESMGSDCFNSFLDETFLVDRQTTIREYLNENHQVMTKLPPPELVDRYRG